VPLSIEELTKAVVETGVVTDTGDRYTVTAPLRSLAIPTSLQASLLARLDRLSATREVAQIAAALGRSFSHELISAVVPMPQQNLDDALTRLVHAELIFRRGTPPDAEYTFKHALVQDTAYSTLLRGKRQQLHGLIASTFESRFAEIAEAQPHLMAQHCAAAGMAEKAIGYWLKAGRQAIAKSSMKEAVAQLRKGADLLVSLPDGKPRQQQELDLLIALGPALIATEGWAASAVGQTYARAGELCEQLHLPQHLGAVLYGQYAHQSLGGELRLAHGRAVALQRLGEARNDVMLISFGHFLVGYSHAVLGELNLARAELEQSLALFDPAQRHALQALTGYDTRVMTLMHLSRTLAWLGYLDQARARRDAALVEARQLAHTFTLACALALGLAGERGERTADARLPLADELLNFSEEHGFPFWAALLAIQRGWCLSMMGREAEGIAQLTGGLAALRSTGTATPLPYVFTLLAEACGQAGQPTTGLEYLAEGAGIMEVTQEREFEAELDRVRGELFLAVGDPSKAEDSFSAALTVARRQSAKLWELRAAMSVARLWRAQGKRDDARDLLAPVYGWFTEGFDTRDLKDAKALLDELA
jgi:predicted ATPase